MRVPYSWLREYVDIKDDSQGLAERLTLGGIQVEEVAPAGPKLPGIVVGRILDVRAHPQADKLVICRVDVGARQVSIVTGAPNVAPDLMVPAALPGSVLPGGAVIEAADFRGVLSEGMLCSEPELGLGGSGEGIMILPNDVAPGTDLAVALGFTDSVLVLELTANRSDCQGIVNVAREAAALSGTRLEYRAIQVEENGSASVEELARVEVRDADLCPRYTARVFVDAKVAESPLWLQNRLRAAGVRPINNVVDVTNYVMLELNQPLHAFDLDRLEGKTIIVRRAGEGETMVTLDGVQRRIPAEALVIADKGRAVAVAGVMGGVYSEITPETRRILLESAYFDPVSVRRTARSLGLRTEASNRFERGVDPEAVGTASDRAAQLLVALKAVTVARGRLDTAPAASYGRRIAVRPSWVNGWLGTNIPAAEMASLLERLDGVRVAGTKASSADPGEPGADAADEALVVETPSYRRDLEEPVDLAEEVARLHGYNRIEETLPARPAVGGLTPQQAVDATVRRVLAARGFREVVANSLTGPDELRMLGLAGDADGHAVPGPIPAHRQVPLMAPLSEDQAVLRTNLLGSMLRTVAYNLNRKNGQLQLFELGRAFIASEDPGALPEEKALLCLAMVGVAQPEHFSGRPRPLDFYDLKGAVESSLSALGIPAAEVAWRRESGHPAFHPGQCALLTSAAGEDDAALGLVGRSHPAVLREFGVEEPVWIAELDFDAVRRMALAHDVHYRELPRFPAIVRDIALVVKEDVVAAEVEKRIRAAAGDAHLVQAVEVFDVYSGDPIPSGEKSLAFHITFRAPERTLRDAEVDEIMEKIAERLRAGLGARVRQ